MYTKAELARKLNDALKLSNEIDVAQNKLDAIKAELKEYMLDSNIERIEAGGRICTLIKRTSRTIDVKRLRAERPDIAEGYGKDSNTCYPKIK